MAPMAARKSGRRVEDLAVVVDVTSLAELPVGLALPRSVGLSEGVEAAVNLVSRAPAPSCFIYTARATGAHQPYGLDTPDQGVIKRHGPIFGSGPGDQLQHGAVA